MKATALAVDEPFKMHGIDFENLFQMQRYGELLLMERAGEIHDLKVHESFGLHCIGPTGRPARVGGIELLFVYWRGQRMFAEEVQPAAVRKSPLYLWRTNHFEHEYGVRVISIEHNKPRSGAGV
jgi:hypothetical protein